jgi:phage-related minor tail protein
MAAGGIVTKPTLALIGESGPEAVIPLRRGSWAGGGVTVNVTVNGWVGSSQELAGKVRDELVALGRREPNIFGSYA